jgi:hypothetical protein
MAEAQGRTMIYFLIYKEYSREKLNIILHFMYFSLHCFVIYTVLVMFYLQETCGQLTLIRNCILGWLDFHPFNDSCTHLSLYLII